MAPPNKKACTVSDASFLLLFKLRLAIDAAINLVFTVYQLELMGKLLLYGRDASGVLAMNNVADGVGKRQVLTLYNCGILDLIHRYAGIHISDNVKVELNHAVDLYNILFAHLCAVCVCNYGNGTFKHVEADILAFADREKISNRLRADAVSCEVHIGSILLDVVI